MATANVRTGREPSDAAWDRFGALGAQILRRLAERDALAELEAVDPLPEPLAA